MSAEASSGSVHTSDLHWSTLNANHQLLGQRMCCIEITGESQFNNMSIYDKHWWFTTSAQVRTRP